MATLRHIASACLIAASTLAPAALAQHGEKGELEAFEAVDPYTKGEREKMQRLGYVTYGPFPWVGAHRTPDITETLGGVEILWVETEHFRIGSSLNTYKIGNDKRERALIEADLELLEERLGRLKPPKKQLDPWLRLHLYAQRAETCYAQFMEQIGKTDADFPKKGIFPREGEYRQSIGRTSQEIGRSSGGGPHTRAGGARDGAGRRARK
jgi:hypothetical protein